MSVKRQILLAFLFTTSLHLMACEDFVLTVLHTNDVHAHIEEFNKYGGACTTKKDCYGGVARRQTVIDEFRKSKKNVILLDGGDQFSGTLWYSYYRGNASVQFMNYANYDAMVCSFV